MDDENCDDYYNNQSERSRQYQQSGSSFCRSSPLHQQQPSMSGSSSGGVGGNGMTSTIGGGNSGGGNLPSSSTTTSSSNTEELEARERKFGTMEPVVGVGTASHHHHHHHSSGGATGGHHHTSGGGETGGGGGGGGSGNRRRRGGSASANIGSRLRRVGPYDVGRTIGKGNFAVVKLAVHRQLRIRVAIKIMNREVIGAAQMNKIAREIEAIKILHHPHIVKLYHVMESGAKIFLVQEYASAGEIFEHVRVCKAFPEADAKEFFWQTVCAVDYCHRSGIVHRDLKAENLLLDANHNVKVADFGFCNFFTPGAKLKTHCGSPQYAAPELFKGELYDGPKADIWSLGVILYILVCGSFPFPGESLQEIRSRVLRGLVRFPFFLSRECEKLIRGMLQVDPSKRASLNQVMATPWMTSTPNIGYYRLLSTWPAVSTSNSQSAAAAADCKHPPHRQSGERTSSSSSAGSSGGGGNGDARSRTGTACSTITTTTGGGEGSTVGGTVGTTIASHIEPDPDLLVALERLKLPSMEVVSSLKENRFDHFYAAYHLLLDKLKRLPPPITNETISFSSGDQSQQTLQPDSGSTGACWGSNPVLPSSSTLVSSSGGVVIGRGGSSGAALCARPSSWQRATGSLPGHPRRSSTNSGGGCAGVCSLIDSSITEEECDIRRECSSPRILVTEEGAKSSPLLDMDLDTACDMEGDLLEICGEEENSDMEDDQNQYEDDDAEADYDYDEDDDYEDEEECTTKDGQLPVPLLAFPGSWHHQQNSVYSGDSSHLHQLYHHLQMTGEHHHYHHQQFHDQQLRLYQQQLMGQRRHTVNYLEDTSAATIACSTGPGLGLYSPLVSSTTNTGGVGAGEGSQQMQPVFFTQAKDPNLLAEPFYATFPRRASAGAAVMEQTTDSGSGSGGATYGAGGPRNSLSNPQSEPGGSAAALHRLQRRHFRSSLRRHRHRVCSPTSQPSPTGSPVHSRVPLTLTPPLHHDMTAGTGFISPPGRLSISSGGGASGVAAVSPWLLMGPTACGSHLSPTAGQQQPQLMQSTPEEHRYQKRYSLPTGVLRYRRRSSAAPLTSSGLSSGVGGDRYPSGSSGGAHGGSILHAGHTPLLTGGVAVARRCSDLQQATVTMGGVSGSTGGHGSIVKATLDVADLQLELQRLSCQYGGSVLYRSPSGSDDPYCTSAAGAGGGGGGVFKSFQTGTASLLPNSASFSSSIEAEWSASTEISRHMQHRSSTATTGTGVSSDLGYTSLSSPTASLEPYSLSGGSHIHHHRSDTDSHTVPTSRHSVSSTATRPHHLPHHPYLPSGQPRRMSNPVVAMEPPLPPPLPLLPSAGGVYWDLDTTEDLEAIERVNKKLREQQHQQSPLPSLFPQINLTDTQGHVVPLVTDQTPTGSTDDDEAKETLGIQRPTYLFTKE